MNDTIDYHLFVIVLVFIVQCRFNHNIVQNFSPNHSVFRATASISITVATRLGILLNNFSQYSRDIVIYIFIQYSSPFAQPGSWSAILSFETVHRFSIRLSSGLFPGHSNTRTSNKSFFREYFYFSQVFVRGPCSDTLIFS